MNEKHKKVSENFTGHLEEYRYNEKTINHYKVHITVFLEWLEQAVVELNQCSYNDLLSYVRHLQKKGISIENQNRYIRAIKYLYNYLIKKSKQATTLLPTCL